MEVFTNAANAGAQLLKAERLAQAGDDETSLTSAYLLTFDVGLILLASDPARGQLVSNPIPDAESVPGGLVDASEEEPWWRLLGCSLAHATATAGPTTLRLDFRISGGGLRSLDLDMVGGAIRAKLAGETR
jgi:hypothetical protein